MKQYYSQSLPPSTLFTKRFRFLFLFFFIGLANSLFATAPPQAALGTAVVDGNSGEWNLTTDFFANMYRAGNSDKEIESKLYLRYNCATSTMYVLVLAQPGVSVLTQADDAYVKFGNSDKELDGNSGNNGTPPDFAWITSSGTTIGWEGSFIVTPGSYSDLNVHVQVFNDRQAQTSAVADRSIPLEIVCPSCVKPNAGVDKIVCAPTTTTSLTGFSPAGGTWSVQPGNPASATVTNEGAVSGMTANGTYRFVYTLNGCADTVAVTRKVKPVVGNAAICAPATTASLTLSPAGGTWTAVGTNPSSASVSPSGIVSGVTVTGTYQFIYTVNGCSDTSTVIRYSKPNAGPDSVGNLAICNTVAKVDLPDANAGETWTQLGTSPKAISVNPTTGVVTGMDAIGIYQFVLTNTSTSCSDTVRVEVKDCRNGSIGDFVWKDLNDNGQQDAGEPGVNGVKVILWRSVNGNPSTRLDSTITAVNGAYSFTGLAAGNYIVQVVTSTLPDNCVISPKQNVGNDATDNDFSQTGLSPVVTLNPVLEGLNRDNNTIDAGLFRPCTRPVFSKATPAAATCTGTISNNDAKFTISGISGGDRYTFATTMAGLASYSSATPFSGSSFTVMNLPNPNNPPGRTYIVRIYNANNDCFTDLTVIIPYFDCSNNCVTPDGGPDVSICSPTTSVNLPDAKQNEEWVVGSSNPADATINPVTGVVQGMTVSGVYTFVLRDKTLGSTCSDEVAVFRGILEVSKLTTCSDTLTLPQIPGATYTKVSGNTANVTPSGFVSGMNGIGKMYTFISTKGECVDTIQVVRLDCKDKYDLALDKSVSKKMPMLGETITYTIRVWNEGEGTVHGIEVTDKLNAGVQYISSIAERGSYSVVSKKWKFDSLTAGDTVSLSIKVRVVAQGVWFNTAEITKMTEDDVDSTPNNGKEDEDDIDRECFTVPILICRGQGGGVQLAVPAQYTGVVWFRKVQGGQPVQVGTGNAYMAMESELGNYEYSFTSTSGTCPAEGCCPIIIVVEDCCPADICVPFVITKKRK
jgi:uncharacterized repeat protein (TIGR01451 family)